MKVIEVSDWSSLLNEVAQLRNEVRSSNSPLLFRGLGNSRWRLDTTLERGGSKPNMRFADYYRLIATAARPVIETFTGIKWDLPDYGGKVDETFCQYDAFHTFPERQLYEYLVYLRHHGFPSPLLDWSHSLYVAAFFAFRDTASEVEKRAIYAFCEMPNSHKGWRSDQPRVRQIGPYVRGHKRHFRQRSDYTICGLFQGEWHFHPHEGLFERNDPEQDFLWKFVIPSTERVRVLSLLDDYNLNAFSLFDSEESLMETTWLREAIFSSKGYLS